MRCEDVQHALDGQLLGALKREDAAALDAHIAICRECQAVVADARRLQAEVRLIGTEGPSPRSWERIAASLENDPEFQRAAAADLQSDRRAWQLDWRWVVLAAALILVVASSLLFLRRSLESSAAPAPLAASAPTDAGSDDLVTSIESELDLAAKHYENAIAGLERVANDSESPIDPALMATVKTNLQIIDQAIDDSRQALRTDPQSQFAQESLFDAFRRKVTLLQDTISLMNEMRKGNPARATAIASGLNKG